MIETGRLEKGREMADSPSALNVRMDVSGKAEEISEFCTGAESGLQCSRRFRGGGVGVFKAGNSWALRKCLWLNPPLEEVR